VNRQDAGTVASLTKNIMKKHFFVDKEAIVIYNKASNQINSMCSYEQKEARWIWEGGW
jgi:hypothetical protein